MATYDFTNVITDHTISATFTVLVHTITASAGPNGIIAPTGAVPVNDGASQQFTITPNAGYMVDEILVDGIPV